MARQGRLDDLEDARLIHFYTLPNVESRGSLLAAQLDVFPQRDGKIRDGNQRIRNCMMRAFWTSRSYLCHLA
jgi:hypothetical protein